MPGTSWSGAALPDAAELASGLARMLDEIDYGMLLLDGEDRLLYLNHAARCELAAEHPLLLQGRQLGVRRAADAAPWQRALAAARRGRRGLIGLGEGPLRVNASVVPLPDNAAGADAAAPVRGAVVIVLGKRQVSEQLSVQGFARSAALTPAETRVLELLCEGARPAQIAERQGVAVSTVRTQISSLRGKTGAASIRDLVRQVAVLPPLVGALRGDAARAPFGARD